MTLSTTAQTTGGSAPGDVRTEPAAPLLVPQTQNRNGATIAIVTRLVPAEQVQVGDVITDSGFINEVTAVRKIGRAPLHGGELVFLGGTYNRCRFAHELVPVIRRREWINMDDGAVRDDIVEEHGARLAGWLPIDELPTVAA